MRQHFSAPWSPRLKAFTAAFVGLTIFVAFTSDYRASLLMVGILIFCLAFAVRGYSVVDGSVLVHRVGWATRIDIARIAAVRYSPGVTIGSMRTWGIGGVFGFVGSFRNATLGNYRAYATEPDNAVVLECESESIVLTPERPMEFVAAVDAARSAQGS